ncbi:MAG TPA: hypothetical protein VIW74_15230 [Pyrinomonadaceae bacterium]|jgi:hypothetical protein
MCQPDGLGAQILGFASDIVGSGSSGGGNGGVTQNPKTVNVSPEKAMQLSREFIFPLALLLAATSCFVASNLVMSAMIGEINRKLPDDQRISYLFFHFSKYRLIYSKYRELYPDGRLLLYYWLCGFGGLVLLLLFAWQFGMFGGH